MNVYIVDSAGVLTGPVELPVIPGLGVSLPSNAVQLESLLKPAKAGMAWVLVDGQAQLLPDNRGMAYDKATGACVYFDQFGLLPPTHTTIPRPAIGYVWADSGWAKDLPHWHLNSTQNINVACEKEITSGFWSTALGDRYQYSSQLDDQLNLTGVILAGLDSPYACHDEQGKKEFRLHTFAQLRRVGDDFTAFKLQLLQKANQRKQLLDQALTDNDLAALEAVTWEDQPS